MPVDIHYIAVPNTNTPMKRILVPLAVLVFSVVDSTPAFGQDGFEKINELIDADSVYVPALLQATLRGDAETVQTLIKEGKDVNEYWYYEEDDSWLYIGYTPLEAATILGDLDIMRLLLDNGAQTEREIENGIVTVSTLGYAKNIKIAQLLLDRGADPSNSLQMIENVNIAQFLIDNGAEVNARDETGTPLHGAAERGNTDMVELLIANGAKVNKWAETRITPLHIASNAEITQILIDNGADIHAMSDGGTPLHTADNAEVAKVLIKSGADVNARNYYSGFTPLYVALRNGEINIAELLIKNGADVNATEDHGITPLHVAISRDMRGMIELLLANGANMNMNSGVDGDTPFHYAISKGQKDIIEILINNGADVEIRDAYEQTPIYYSGNVEITQLLLDHGADVNAKNSDGRTPLDIAIAEGRDEIAALLREHGGVATQ